MTRKRNLHRRDAAAASSFENCTRVNPLSELGLVNQKVKRTRYRQRLRMRMRVFLSRCRRFAELGRIHEDALRLRIVRHGLGPKLRL